MPVFTFEFEVYDCVAVNCRARALEICHSSTEFVQEGSTSCSVRGQHQRHVVSVTATSVGVPPTDEMVPKTTSTRLVQSPYSTNTAYGGASFVVGQTANIIPSASIGRRNVPPSIGTIIPLQTQNLSNEESMSLIVQLGTTVVATSKPQMLADSSNVADVKLSSVGQSVGLNYQDFQSGSQITGTAQVHQTQRSPVIQSPNVTSVVNSNVRNISCSMQQIHVQHQVIQRQPVTVKQFQSSIKPLVSAQASPVERRLEFIEDVKKEKLEEKGLFKSENSYASQLQTEERRMEIVKFVLQDHNYGAPPPTTPPVSPPHHGKSINGTSNSTSTLGASNLITSSSVYQYGSGLLALREAAANDDDANSVISSNPGREVEPEGEETETAPEGEGDDEDSVTRCICDFEHDDGYMICCDKCFVWQHVDCMGIDRSNIPDEYMCERCQPRRVDRQRARTLQLRKREELLNTDSSSDTSSSSTDTDSGMTNPPVLPSKKRVAATTVNRRKSEPSSTGSRKNMTSSSSSNINANNNNMTTVTKQQRQRRDSLRDLSHVSPVSVATQRRASTGQSRKKETRATTENKRTSTRRKSKTRMSEDESQDSWDRVTSGPGAMVQLRQWIDNYEEAVTNHYSPELRARISSIKVNGIHSDLKSGNLHSVSSGATKCRVSQLAPGVRILVSTALLSSNQPVIELRGKYMLSTQHRPPSLTLFNNKRTRPSPGPFIFFYRLPKDGTEVCVDTRTYGNDARFIRRSCRPNAEVRHCIEKGILHLYIVTTTTVEKNSEITINHDGTQDTSAVVNNCGSVQQFVCACGNPKECTALNRRNGVHESTDRERRRRGRRTTSSDDGDSVPVSSHQSNVSHSLSQTITNINSGDGPPSRRSSSNTRSPVKVSQHEQENQVHQQPPQQQQQQQHQQQQHLIHVQQQQQQQVQQQHQQLESGDRESAASESVTDQQDKKRKLTREERKMEAIMKAFERLEKAEQRRQENQAKQANRKEHHDSTSSSTPKKDSAADGKRQSIDEREEVHRQQINKPSAPDRPRRKRRKGRGRASSLSQNPQPQHRRRTRLNSGDSDVTSAEETIIATSSNAGGHSPPPPATPPPDTSHHSSPVSTAAGLLLALANGNTPDTTLPSYHHTPPHHREQIQSTTPQIQGGVNPTLFCDGASSSGSGSSQGSTPPTPLSSACLLVAAAVGPLAPGFKFPKTKKVLMNEWLNKSPDLPPATSTVPAPMTSPILPRPSDLPLNPTDLMLNPQVADSYGFTTQHSSSKSLATLAQAANRVASGSSLSPTSNFCRNNLGTRGPVSAPGSGVGSAKKRWLRQAISEECDSPTTNSCASPNSRAGSPPCPDYVTPLKKRRLARESMSSEQSFTPPTTPTMLADQQLSSSSPTSQKCAHYDLSGMNSGVCEEEDDAVGDEEAPLLNDDEFGDREEKFEAEFNGNGSPVHADDCYETQRIVRDARTTKCSAAVLIQADESGTVDGDGESYNRISGMNKNNQSELEDEDDDGKEKEIEDNIQAKESSVEEECEDDDSPSSPVPNQESKNFLRGKAMEIKLQLSVNSSEETEEEGCRGFEEQEEREPHGSEDNIGSDSELLNGDKTEVCDTSRIVKEIDYVNDIADELVSPAVSVKNTEISPSISTLQEPPKPEMSVVERENISSKDEILKGTTSLLLKTSDVPRNDIVPPTSVTCTPVQPAKRKLSISEYRQRKQRTSTELKSQGTESDGGNGSTSAFQGSRGRTNSTSSSSSLSSDDDTPNVCTTVTNKNILLENSPSLSTLPLFLQTEGSEDKKGVGEETYMRWNSAPTLVERQRENLTERLRREFGLFLSDDEEQERARKQGLVQEVKDGKKKVPPPPPPPPLPPLETSSSSSSGTQHMIPMYSTAQNSALPPVYPSVLVPNSSVSPSINYISSGGNAGYTSVNTNCQPISGQAYNAYSINSPIKNQTYGSFPAGLGTKAMSNNSIPTVKGSSIPPVSSVAAVYQTSTVNSGSGKSTQKYLLATPPPPPSQNTNTQFVLSAPYGTASTNLSSPSSLMVGSSRGVASSGTTQGTTHFVPPSLPAGNSSNQQQTAVGNTSAFYTAAAAKAYYPPPPPPPLPLPPPPPPPPRT